MGVMRILGRSGDTEVRWNAETGEGLKSAERIFKEKTGLGYLAFAEGSVGEQPDLIWNFNARADSIILAPRLVGG